MAVSFKGAHFPPDVILMGIRWYLAYPLSTRHVEELMQERGVNVDHSTVNRWVIKYSPQVKNPAASSGALKTNQRGSVVGPRLFRLDGTGYTGE